jgi:carbamoyl-phosphate synthase large subunit
MPKRTDIKTILVLGSGPIVIGQGCEFDYSGTQACKALRAEGYRIVLVNSNPATIMTDPQFSDRTYIEPITPESVRKIILKEQSRGPRIDAILPTLGGQTALNCACKLWDNGTLQEFGIEMIGASREIIHRAEDRQIFKDICEKIGLKLPKAKTVTTLAAAEEFLKEIGLPAIIRPAFTLGGTGGGIAYNLDEFKDIISRGLAASMIGQVQIDQSVIGWKEYELEVIRDKKDNCIIVCGIENIDPMGVHTGDSITVAPILTLTDKEYQAMRDAAIAVMRAVGVETGGSNVQFAVNPNPKEIFGPEGRPTKPFEMVVVEMNPRVSRSSALASKATGFPIAKIAAKLAVGYTLDELRNDITGTTSACFEPAIDYVVTKIPRWTFEKFPEADETLTTQMKSVGEAMAIGRTFKESFQKAIRSMEVKRFGLGLDKNDKWLTAMRAVEKGDLLLDISPGAKSHNGLRTADGQPIEWPIPLEKLSRKLAVPCVGRPYYVRYAFKMGWSIERVQQLSNIDPFFLDQMKQLVEFEDELCAYRTLEEVPADVLFRAKQMGYSDAQLANLYLGDIKPDTILKVRSRRQSLGIEPVYKMVDTCAAEFEAITPYYYSTYETGIRDLGFGIRGSNDHIEPNAESPMPNAVTRADDEIRVSEKKKVIILGGGPNRIGQGIEFDYCCCHAAFAARELGFESVMINSNPETVSTDYDTSDLLFFEPLTLEDVLNVVERLNGTSTHQSDTSTSTPSSFLPAQQPVPQRGVDASKDSKKSARSADVPLVHGLIVQFGGQTPLNLAKGLVAAGAPIIGTSLDSIDTAEDRERFDEILERLKISRPPSGIARSLDEAVVVANRIGYPVLVRPSYVLGGRGMEVCSDEKTLRNYVNTALKLSGVDDAPVLIDRFLDSAIECDVDVVADYRVPRDEETKRRSDGARQRGSEAAKLEPTSGSPASSLRLSVSSSLPTGRAVICGLMEHIEQAGIHSGDSSCTIPAYSLSKKVQTRIREIAHQLAEALRVNGLMNVQLAIKDDEVFILEVNPRASRTAPFVSKARHIPWPAIAARVMMGQLLDDQRITETEPTPDEGFAVKESVFPFSKFPGVDVVLGPEMRSTGEVMGLDMSFPMAFAKAQMATSAELPRQGGVFLSVREEDRPQTLEVARSLLAMGFTVYTTQGTGEFLEKHRVKTVILQKIASGARPNVLDLMHNKQINLVLNTPTRTGWKTDEGRIRATAVRLGIPMISTMAAAHASVKAIEAMRAGDWDVAALQDYKPSGMAEPKPTQPVSIRT